jgi:predicted ribosome quality control (RQC) complex YloA/Tae2 family protein
MKIQEEEEDMDEGNQIRAFEKSKTPYETRNSRERIEGAPEEGEEEHGKRKRKKRKKKRKEGGEFFTMAAIYSELRP